MEVMTRPDEPFGSYLLSIELWLKIFKHATECDLERGVLDCMLRSGPDPLEIGRLPFEQLCNAWDAEIVRTRLDYSTRISITLVSRTWHDLMLPILYHAIVLLTSSQLKQFTILLRSKSHLGTFVKILGIDRTIESFWLFRDRDKYIGRDMEDTLNVQEIYKRCTNIFVMDDHAHHCNIWSLEDEINYGRKLQYMLISRKWLSYHAEFYETLLSFNDLRFIAFNLRKPESIQISLAPRLTLPRLEILSLSINHKFNEQIDRYFGEAELPSLHTLHLTLRTTSRYNPQTNDLDRLQAIWSSHGTRIKTLKIRGPTGIGWLGPWSPHESFKLDRHLVNLQQLVVDVFISGPLLAQFGTCSTITTLEISDVESGSDPIEPVASVEWVLGSDVCQWFENLQTLRLSVPPDLFGREITESYIMDEVEYAIEQYRASIEARGVKIISEIRLKDK